MNAKQFFDAVVDMRWKGRMYYACKASINDPKKQKLLKDAIAAEKVVDDEIERVQAILDEQKLPKLNLG